MAFSGFDELDPRFADALQRMIAERPGIVPFSGYRDYAHQARLYQAAIAKYGSPEAARHWVAPPGHSNHNFRLAADLNYASPEDEAWAHANARRFGLDYRMNHEPKHIELMGAKPSGDHVNVSMYEPRNGVTNDGKYQYELPPGYQEQGTSLSSQIPDIDPRDSAPSSIQQKDLSLVASDFNTLASLLHPKLSDQRSELLKRIKSYPA